MPPTRSGCVTCRIRKVKCDEGKPKCHRCTATGRTCDGYTTIPLTRGDLRMALDTLQHPHFPSALPCVLTDPAFQCVLDKRFFQFFRQCTIASTKQTIPSAFWDSLVLQACHTHPTVKHAVLAIGAYHDSLIHHKDKAAAQHLRLYADRHYQRALVEARNVISDTGSSPEVHSLLLACHIFTLYEGMRGNYSASATHMANGRKIIAQYRPRKRITAGSTALDEIATAFARLDLVSLTFSDVTAPYQYTLRDLLNTAPELHSQSYSSVQQAHAALVDLIRLTFMLHEHIYVHGDSDIRAENECRRQLLACRQRLIKWKQHWHKLLTALPKPPPESQTKTIECWYLAASVDADANFPTLVQSEYDCVMPHFARIVSLLEDVSTSIRDSSASAPPSVSFTLDLGFIVPAFFTAIRCRDPGLRRRAIAVLESMPRREGLWESTFAAAIAKKWMQLEEEGLERVACSADVPESRRFAQLEPWIDVENLSARLLFISTERKVVCTIDSSDITRE
ncbi:hypothetical protein BDY17DRAFT_297355 [Neohortaea acidophila]|uniref:Zn(2)-C6 fungal-type domain-containing protein n=1 Tax=Neohortaea acidophila TaxID=245834 RepID=A0A6A6PVS3_9PEZI|nr:uncharacterized protein BDY17DRAFT_297355 [Neohortaea acidophila]KAF2483387.1 hypothetical protein BDY17DRAFT_297355 [Neohortaea acidophila]